MKRAQRAEIAQLQQQQQYPGKESGYAAHLASVVRSGLQPDFAVSGGGFTYVNAAPNVVSFNAANLMKTTTTSTGTMPPTP